MLTRREALSTLAAAAGASALSKGIVHARSQATQRPEIRTALNGPVGLQLWSLREYLPKDLKGTLAKVRAMGFREVEGAGLWGASVTDLRAALDAAGLRCRSAHLPFERLRDAAPAALAEAKALGATWVVCPWIPHKGEFTRETTLASAEAFNRFGAAARDAGLRFAYHCHGYEFVKAPEGTLFDVLAGATDPARVAFQVDVFHTFHGGGDPAAVITRYKDRVPSLHLKDLKKGVTVKAGTAIAPPEEDVPVGSGQVDMAAVLRAARDAGTSLYYLEDESRDPLTGIPQSVKWLQAFTF
jgi:sugar phosphate isomerase/epimerase